MDTDARSAFRALQLPCRLSSESLCVARLIELVLVEADANSSPSAWVDVEISTWEASGAPSASLRRVVRDLLSIAAPFEPDRCQGAYKRFSERYFNAHEGMKRNTAQTFGEARATLSYASIVIELAIESQLSAAQISRMMSSRDSRAKISRQVVAEILRPAAALPRIDVAQVRAVFDRDSLDEPSAFKDASFLVAAEEVAAIASAYVDERVLLNALCVLSPEFDKVGRLSSVFTPYLQILHYQCSLCEHFDHYLHDLYEFNPRGGAAEWLFDQYPASISNASNPFLNNAKAVEVIGESWARLKKSAEAPGARALLAIFDALDGLSFLARREMSRWIRMWLHRIIRISEDKNVALPDQLTIEQIGLVARRVSAGNTKTFGIVEQRFVDVVASLVNHGKRSRGLGDAVNATNVSRKKFGDCEFADNQRLVILAYEAHAGGLSNVYVRQHLLSIKKTVRHRINELQLLADVGEWTVRVIFVAHRLGDAQPAAETIEGLRFEVELVQFTDILESLNDFPPDQVMEAFSNAFVAPINSKWTPDGVRHQVADMAGLIH